MRVSQIDYSNCNYSKNTSPQNVPQFKGKGVMVCQDLEKYSARTGLCFTNAISTTFASLWFKKGIWVGDSTRIRGNKGFVSFSCEKMKTIEETVGAEMANFAEAHHLDFSFIAEAT